MPTRVFFDVNAPPHTLSLFAFLGTNMVRVVLPDNCSARIPTVGLVLITENMLRSAYPLTTSSAYAQSYV